MLDVELESMILRVSQSPSHETMSSAPAPAAPPHSSLASLGATDATFYPSTPTMHSIQYTTQNVTTHSYIT